MPSSLARVALAATGAVAAIQTATAVVALRTGRRDYADVVWGPGLAAAATVAAATGDASPVRRWTHAAIVAGWATRLSRHIGAKAFSSDEEDPRYTEFLEGDSKPVVAGKVFLTQAVTQVLVSAPLQVAAVAALPDGPRRWLFPAGAAVAVGGAVMEAVADKQKKDYSDLGDDKPPVLDTGLWAWSRHPNYLGDAILWTGLWLSSAASAPAGRTWPAPVAMAYLLVYATGAKRTEKHMEERPAYRDYQQRVSFFLPRPPKSEASHAAR